MKFSVVLFCLSFCFTVKSQDTLCYKNGNKAAVVLKEITPTEIKYQKFDMQDGPLFVINKNDIDKIIYKNGYTEVITAVVVNTPAPVIYQSYYKEKITYNDTRVKYNTLVNLAHGHKDMTRQPGLSQLALSIKKLKPAQDGTRTGAIVFGALAIAGTALYGIANLFDNGDNTLFIAPPIAFGVLAVALTSLSVTFNIKLNTKRKAFVNLYNE